MPAVKALRAAFKNTANWLQVYHLPSLNLNNQAILPFAARSMVTEIQPRNLSSALCVGDHGLNHQKPLMLSYPFQYDIVAFLSVVLNPNHRPDQGERKRRHHHQSHRDLLSLNNVGRTVTRNAPFRIISRM